MIPSSAAPKNKWHTTCLGVLTEPWLLIKSIICPCNAYKEAVESLVEEDVGCLDSVFGGVCLLCGFDLRVRFRETLNLEGNPTEDFCMHVFCHCCSLVQMKRESKYWADYIPKKRPVRPRMGIPRETFQGFPEVVSNQPRPAPTPRREPMSPTPVFHSMNVDVVTVSPDVSEITRVESPSEERKLTLHYNLVAELVIVRSFVYLFVCLFIREPRAKPGRDDIVSQSSLFNDSPALLDM
eukprot:g2896.t1